MIKKHLLVSLVLFLFLSFQHLLSGQEYFYDFNNNCLEAYELIIQLRFDEGQEILNTEKKLNPDNNIPYLLENYIYYFTLFIGENENEYDIIVDNYKNEVFDRLEKGDPNSPFYLYSLGQAYMQWGFSQLKFTEYISAAFNIRKSYVLFEENNELFPDFPLNKMTLGMMHAAIGSVPDSYSWVINTLGIEGTIEQGVEEMNSILEVSYADDFYQHFRPEILFYLSFLHINITNDLETALSFVEYSKITEDSIYMNNPLFIYAYSRVYSENNQNDKALELLLNKPSGPEYYPFYYLDFLIGDLKLRKLENDAYKYLLRFVMNFHGKTFIKTAYQKLAWYYLINDQPDKYYEYMDKVLRYGDKIGDPDKQAEREAKTGIPPDKYLLKARLLSDGGYFEEANSIMLNNKNDILAKASLRDSVEYYYRRGRIFHEWGKKQDAKVFYQTTINKGKNLPNYFAANACLKIGNIYEEEGFYEQALYYYEKVRNLPNKEYKMSINQKAKSGINRIEEKTGS